MKTVLGIIIVAIGLCTISGCMGTVGIMVANTFESKPEKGWANKSHREYLMNHSEKILLSSEEKTRVSKAICSFKYMKNPIKERMSKYKGKKFCNIKLDDKIYFFKEITGSTGLVSTEYLLVRDEKPFESIQIEKEYSKELKRSIPIVEQLH